MGTKTESPRVPSALEIKSGTLQLSRPVEFECEADQLLAATESGKEKLLGGPNVLGVGHGLKETGGELIDDPAVIVFVQEKLPPDELEQRGYPAVPDTFDGVKTDVVAFGSRRHPAQNAADAAFIDWAALGRAHEARIGPQAIHGAAAVDIDNIAVVEDDGAMVLPNGHINYVRAYQKFRETHPDIYDFVTFFADFPVPFGYSFWSGVLNQTEGIGLGQFDSRATWGSNRLQGFHFMNPGHVNWMFAYLQEVGHQWGAFVYFKNYNGEPVNHGDLLLGGTPGHWSRFFDNDHSPMDYDAVDWVDNGNGTFTDHSIEEIMFCDLDLYLMGLLAPGDARPFYYIEDPVLQSGQTYAGNRKDLAVQNVIWAMGKRKPDHTRAQRQFKQAFILVTNNMATAGTTAELLEQRRRQFTETFYRATRYLARIDTTLQPANAKVNTGTIRLQAKNGKIEWSPTIVHGLGNVPVAIHLGYETSLSGSPIDAYPDLKTPDIVGGISHLSAQVAKPYDGTFRIVMQSKTADVDLVFRWWAYGLAYS